MATISSLAAPASTVTTADSVALVQSGTTYEATMANLPFYQYNSGTPAANTLMRNASTGGKTVSTSSVFIDSNNNLGIGLDPSAGSNFGDGTSIYGILAATNTSPATIIGADMAYAYVADQATDNACWHFMSEDETVVKLYQQADIVDYTVTWTANEPTAGDSATIADGNTPTVAELGQAVADLTAKLNGVLSLLRNNGLMA